MRRIGSLVAMAAAVVGSMALSEPPARAFIRKPQRAAPKLRKWADRSKKQYLLKGIRP
jgi:hypothetical protein